jgi:hypothetical protein
MPFWSDAIGQIPFAVDTYLDYRQAGLTHGDAAERTRQIGSAFHSGSFLEGVLNRPTGRGDYSNHYDNWVISPTIDWAGRNVRLANTMGGRMDRVDRSLSWVFE